MDIQTFMSIIEDKAKLQRQSEISVILIRCIARLRLSQGTILDITTDESIKAIVQKDKEDIRHTMGQVERLLDLQD
jgi:hypothetical protein